MQINQIEFFSIQMKLLQKRNTNRDSFLQWRGSECDFSVIGCKVFTTLSGFFIWQLKNWPWLHHPAWNYTQMKWDDSRRLHSHKTERWASRDDVASTAPESRRWLHWVDAMWLAHTTRLPATAATNHTLGRKVREQTSGGHMTRLYHLNVTLSP